MTEKHHLKQMAKEESYSKDMTIITADCEMNQVFCKAAFI